MAQLFEDMAKDPVRVRTTPKKTEWFFTVHYRRPNETTTIQHIHMSLGQAISLLKKFQVQIQYFDNLGITFEGSIKEAEE